MCQRSHSREIISCPETLAPIGVSYNFSGRVCLVTGGAQGIGLAIAQTFAAYGASVVIADLSRDMGSRAVEMIKSAGGCARCIATDVGDRDAIRALISECEAELGRLDIIVHNAAYFPLTDFEKIDEAVLKRTLAVNLEAAFWLSQGVLPSFKRLGGGRILLTSSVTGPRVAYPGLAHYAASKAGINGFIRAAALELAKFNVTVNGVEPGMIATSAMENLGGTETRMALEKRVPLKRLGTPQDIAAAMVFLASDAASYITGQTLVVDGGALLPECGASW